MTTAAPTSRIRRRNAAAAIAPYLFVGAAAIYLLFFMVVPMARGLWFSFTDATLLNPDGGQFVGGKNYGDLLTSGAFYSSLLTTLLYTAGTVIGSLLFGTVAAVALSERIRGRAVFRALLTIPWAVPSVAAVLVFIWIFNVESGVANRATKALGIGAQGWLLDPKLGLLSVTLVSVWKVFPFVMLVVLAALQGVPGELREAARVDGADRLNVFRTVTLPHIVPTLRIVALLMTIWSIRRFEVIYLLTGGGPIDTTNTIVISVYREAFQNSQLGQAAAIGMLGLCLSMVVTVVYFLSDRSDARKDAR
ncbi:sugar ABC transporter permease [Pseudolysinimonas kribbensis]|uniref:Sugar ABC transporter n=1 Tax=Pseudolysinimonas kribbensis TaxID=433641 RepID=A0ABQ6K5Z9_9MICO|nr:sugar ABC transporter permease [Pseudolysinimonas kribbensis]GMA95392.1 sugar ABC transporter [Pseudolysinimonas kribbensis]